MALLHKVATRGQYLIDTATRLDGAHCVVANAIKRDKNVVEIWVGKMFTTITFASGVTYKYRTHPQLAEALERFDGARWVKGGGWNLPVGKYQLKPLTYSLTKKRQRVYRTRYRKALISGTVEFRGLYKERQGSPRHLENLRRKKAA